MEKKFDNARLKRFAQYARRSLIEQVSTKFKLVLADESAARRENPAAVRKLEENIKERTEKQVLERVAYIWFNRFCALRFMDVNRYNRINIVSPLPGQFQPEILAEAKMGHIDDEVVTGEIQSKVNALLTGKSPSRDPQGEAYRLLVVAACNYWHRAMPFLFERIEDYTELLMPDDLLSGNSILAYTRETMTPDVCKDVEVIGWLYQFYISEKKDEVFDILRRGKKIESENIPAATQLFTPDYIVNYLVENSLGRLWMLNHPKSGLADEMKYYIPPSHETTADKQDQEEFLKIASPEEIKICDPACGSGHMLVYSFDLLVKIYKEVYGDVLDIPERILTHNLYGIEIDERAGELAAFALTMKALQYDKRFIRRLSTRSEPVQPNICVLEKVELTPEQTDSADWKKIVYKLSNTGVDASTLVHDLHLFVEADNFGSLLKPKMTADETNKALAALEAYDQIVRAPSFDHKELVSKCRRALQQAAFLISLYHVVVANPPYMGSGGMNTRLASWAKDNYPDSKSDLFAMFMERNLDLAMKNGSIAMITMQGWMFLSSFEKLRSKMLSQDTILSMAHLGARAFDSIGGEVVSTTAFILKNSNHNNYKGSYLRLVKGMSEEEKMTALLEVANKRDCNHLFYTAAADFKKVPGSPIAYWLSDRVLAIFASTPSLDEKATPRQGLATSDNNRFVRAWSEVSLKRIGFGCADRKSALASGRRFFPFNKGGTFRRWAGNTELVVNWENDGAEIKASIIGKYPYLKGNPDFVAKNPNFYFRSGLTWSALSSGLFSIRYQPAGFIFADKGQAMFPYSDGDMLALEGLLNSKVVIDVLKAISPTLDFNAGYIAKIPCLIVNSPGVSSLNTGFLNDWDSYETSWGFASLPLLDPDSRQMMLKSAYQKLRVHWEVITHEMHRLEEENNLIFIEAYGLKDEMNQDVPLSEITLTCNPHYRYGGDKSDAELESLLLADTLREFISYAVGCMFGRYALEKPGLILANQGETLEDYLRLIPEPIFPADKDNVIPMLDGDWFSDDISERFLKFLRVTFGEEYFEENLKFIEKALGKEIRKYFFKDF
jgi:type II restriction/modification system DNA methylase subunit YeeA